MGHEMVFFMSDKPEFQLSNRRRFLKVSGSLGGTALLSDWPAWAQDNRETLRFGIIADVHKDVMHDADERLSSFIDHMKKERVDFIVQLGDFCVPKEANQPFLDIWNSFSGPRYHVIGNHDTDGGYSREQTVDWWKMPSRYYSFQQAGMQFIVLDGNDRPADHAGGYPRYIAEDQLEWLRDQLDSTDLPVVVLVHQSLERESDGGVQNGAKVRQILEDANASAGHRKVVACFSGHHHRDYVRRINDILYPQINSASYHWVGAEFQHVRYSEAIDQAYPYIKYTVPYENALFAIVTIDPTKGFMSIEGKQSAFVGPAPWDLGPKPDGWDAPTLTPNISTWKMPV